MYHEILTRFAIDLMAAYDAERADIFGADPGAPPARRARHVPHKVAAPDTATDEGGEVAT